MMQMINYDLLFDKLNSFKINVVVMHTSSIYVRTTVGDIKIGNFDKESFLLVINKEIDLFIAKEDIIGVLDCINKENHFQITFKNGDFIEFL